METKEVDQTDPKTYNALLAENSMKICSYYLYQFSVFFEALLLVYDITNRKSYDNIKVGYNSINILYDVVFKENGPK